MTNCQHEVFRADVDVNRIGDADQPLRFAADVRITCDQCKQRFRFLGLPAGIDFERPTCDITGTELHAPIEPELVPMLHASATFKMPPEIP